MRCITKKGCANLTRTFLCCFHLCYMKLYPDTHCWWYVLVINLIHVVVVARCHHLNVLCENILQKHHRLFSLTTKQHDGCRWHGIYLVPGHFQLPLRHRTTCAYQEPLEIMVSYLIFYSCTEYTPRSLMAIVDYPWGYITRIPWDNGLFDIRYSKLKIPEGQENCTKKCISYKQISKWLSICTGGQFWPSDIVMTCICGSVRGSVCVCINHLLVRMIIHRPFKLELPNLDQKCKTSCLRTLIFWGVINLDLQGKI